MELEAHPHPASLIIMAHLRALETRRDMNQRFTLRRELTKLLYGKGYGRKNVLEIMRLLDWLLTLPPELGLAHRRWIVEYEKEKAMPFVTSYEIFSREEGRQEGRREERQNLTLRQLRKRVGELDETTQMRIKDLPSERLEDLAEALLDFTSMADLQNWLRSTS